MMINIFFVHSSRKQQESEKATAIQAMYRGNKARQGIETQKQEEIESLLRIQQAWRHKQAQLLRKEMAAIQKEKMKRTGGFGSSTGFGRKKNVKKLVLVDLHVREGLGWGMELEKWFFD